MIFYLITTLFQKEPKIPESFIRMVKAEYKSVPLEYVEYFYSKHNRLPTAEELYDVI